MCCKKLFTFLIPLLSFQVFSQNITPVTGSINGVVIPIQFQDVRETISLSEINDAFNKIDNNPSGSVRNYFKAVSNQNLDLSANVTELYTAPENKSNYDVSNFDSLISDAIGFIDANGYDFAQFSKDDDNTLKSVYILYAGEMISLYLRPVSTTISPIDVDGITIKNVVIMPTENLLDVSTICHETGHMVCKWNDLYDYNDDAYGSYGFGNYADYPNAVFRYMCGWEDVIDITNAQPGQTFTANLNGNRSYKYSNPNNPNEFYIIEGRKKEGLNSSMPDEGLMAIHVDLSKRGNDANEMTPENHYQISLVQADGLFNLENKINRGDTNDLFNDGEVTVFNDTTMPNAHWWDGKESGLSICNINTTDSQMSFMIGNKVTKPVTWNYNMNVSVNSTTREAEVSFDVDPTLVGVVRNAEFQIFKSGERISYSSIKPTRSQGNGTLNFFDIPMMGYSTGDYTMRLVYNKTVMDSTDFTLLPLEGGVISTSPSQLVFYNVPLGSSMTKTIKLINDGNKDITITNLTTNYDFYQIDESAPLIIPACSYKEIHVTFTPAEPDDYTDAIMGIVSNAVNNQSIMYSLNENDIGLTVTPSVFSTNAVISFSAYYNSGEKAMLSLYRLENSVPVFIQSFQCEIGNGFPSIDIPEWDYLPAGLYRLGIQLSDSSRVVDSCEFEKQMNPNKFFMSIGPSPVVNQASISFTNDDAKLVGKKARFDIIKNNSIVYSTSSTIQTGLNNLSINFNSYFNLEPGIYKIRMSVHSFPVDSSSFVKEDKNTTVVVNDSSFDFSDVVIGESKSVSLVVTNTGNSSAVISGMYSSSNQFTVTNTLPKTLQPGESVTINVVYSPTTSGPVDAELTIINAPDENIQNLTVQLAGNGVTANIFRVEMVPDNNPDGNSISPTIKIKNIGQSEIDLSDIEIQYYSYEPNEGSSQMVCDMYYSSNLNVSSNFVKFARVYGTPTYKADMMLQLQFSSGTLSSDSEITLQYGVHRDDWQYIFNENDDYSRVIISGEAKNIIIKSKTTGNILYGNPF